MPRVLTILGMARSTASSAPPATTSSVPAASHARNGSLRIVSAIPTESSGAVPIRIAVREGISGTVEWFRERETAGL